MFIIKTVSQGFKVRNVAFNTWDVRIVEGVVVNTDKGIKNWSKVYLKDKDYLVPYAVHIVVRKLEDHNRVVYEEEVMDMERREKERDVTEHVKAVEEVE